MSTPEPPYTVVRSSAELSPDDERIVWPVTLVRWFHGAPLPRTENRPKDRVLQRLWADGQYDVRLRAPVSPPAPSAPLFSASEWCRVRCGTVERDLDGLCAPCRDRFDRPAPVSPPERKLAPGWVRLEIKGRAPWKPSFQHWCSVHSNVPIPDATFANSDDQMGCCDDPGCIERAYVYLHGDEDETVSRIMAGVMAEVGGRPAKQDGFELYREAMTKAAPVAPPEVAAGTCDCKEIEGHEGYDPTGEVCECECHWRGCKIRLCVCLGSIERSDCKRHGYGLCVPKNWGQDAREAVAQHRAARARATTAAQPAPSPGDAVDDLLGRTVDEWLEWAAPVLIRRLLRLHPSDDGSPSAREWLARHEARLK